MLARISSWRKVVWTTLSQWDGHDAMTQSKGMNMPFLNDHFQKPMPVLGDTPVLQAVQDYRDIDGPFDRIVSVGMFEHVGVNFYDTYFKRCAELLSEDGVMFPATVTVS